MRLLWYKKVERSDWEKLGIPLSIVKYFVCAQFIILKEKIKILKENNKKYVNYCKWEKIEKNADQQQKIFLDFLKGSQISPQRSKIHVAQNDFAGDLGTCQQNIKPILGWVRGQIKCANKNLKEVPDSKKDTYVDENILSKKYQPIFNIPSQLTTKMHKLMMKIKRRCDEMTTLYMAFKKEQSVFLIKRLTRSGKIRFSISDNPETILKQLQKLVFGQFRSFRNLTILSDLILTIWGHLRSLNFGALEPPKCQFLKLFEYNWLDDNNFSLDEDKRQIPFRTIRV